MKEKLSSHRFGLVVGVFAVAVHVLWSLMVLLGFGQGFADWITGLHMTGPIITVGAFSWGTAITLWIAAFVVGYILGWLFAWANNFVLKRK